MTDNIRVETSVKAADKAATASMSAKLTTDSINRELATTGLPAATVFEVAAESADGVGSTTPTSSAKQSTEGVPLAAIIGGGVGALVLALACTTFFWRYHRNRKSRLEEGTVVSGTTLTAELVSGTTLTAELGHSSDKQGRQDKIDVQRSRQETDDDVERRREEEDGRKRVGELQQTRTDETQESGEFMVEDVEKGLEVTDPVTAAKLTLGTLGCQTEVGVPLEGGVNLNTTHAR